MSVCLADLHLAHAGARARATALVERTRRRRGRALAAATALAAALAVVACGEAEQPAQVTAPAVTGADQEAVAAAAPSQSAPEDEPDPDPASDRGAISRNLETVMTSADPQDVCMALVTERFVREAYGDPAGCARAQADLKPAKAARVSRVVVLPDSVAQASVVADGGLYAGERLRAELVLDAGVWKLDSLRSNVPVGP